MTAQVQYLNEEQQELHSASLNMWIMCSKLTRNRPEAPCFRFVSFREGIALLSVLQYSMIRYLSQMSVPLAMIVLGAGLKISVAASFFRELAAGIFMRLAAAPVIGFSVIFAAQRSGLITLTPAAVAMLVSVLRSRVGKYKKEMARRNA